MQTRSTPMADRIDNARHGGDVFLVDTRRVLASAILANAIESYFTPALLYVDSGRVIENQEVTFTNFMVKDYRLMASLFSRIGLSRSGVTGAYRAFDHMSKLRAGAIRAANKDPEELVVSAKDRGKNLVRVRLKRLYKGSKSKGIFLAAHHMGVNTDELFHSTRKD